MPTSGREDVVVHRRKLQFRSTEIERCVVFQLLVLGYLHPARS